MIILKNYKKRVIDNKNITKDILTRKEKRLINFIKKNQCTTMNLNMS